MKKRILFIGTGGHHRLGAQPRRAAARGGPGAASELCPGRRGAVRGGVPAALRAGQHGHRAGALAWHGRGDKGELRRLRRLCDKPRHGHHGLHRRRDELPCAGQPQAHNPHRRAEAHRGGRLGLAHEPARQLPLRRREGDARRVHRFQRPRHTRHPRAENAHEELRRLHEHQLSEHSRRARRAAHPVHNPLLPERAALLRQAEPQRRAAQAHPGDAPGAARVHAPVLRRADNRELRRGRPASRRGHARPCLRRRGRRGKRWS